MTHQSMGSSSLAPQREVGPAPSWLDPSIPAMQLLTGCSSPPLSVRGGSLPYLPATGVGACCMQIHVLPLLSTAPLLLLLCSWMISVVLLMQFGSSPEQFTMPASCLRKSSFLLQILDEHLPFGSSADEVPTRSTDILLAV